MFVCVVVHAGVDVACAAQATLITTETREKGSVGLGLIKKYAHAMGGVSVLALIMFTFLTIEALRLYASIWVRVLSCGYKPMCRAWVCLCAFMWV